MSMCERCEEDKPRLVECACCNKLICEECREESQASGEMICIECAEEEEEYLGEEG